LRSVGNTAKRLEYQEGRVLSFTKGFIMYTPQFFQHFILFMLQLLLSAPSLSFQGVRGTSRHRRFMSHAPSHWDTVDAVEEAMEEDVEEVLQEPEEAVVKPGHKKQAKSPKKTRSELQEPKQPRPPPASNSRISAVPKTGLGLNRHGKRPDGGAESKTADLQQESRTRQGHKHVGSSKA
jgi:hypothetical protein